MGVNGVANSTTSLPDVTFSDDTIGAVGTVWNAENQPTTAAGEGEIWGQFDAPGGDLSVTITVLSDASPVPGASVSFEIEWENQGTTTIPDVTLTSSVDALFQNAVGSPVPDVTGPPMEWSLGTLRARRDRDGHGQRHGVELDCQRRCRRISTRGSATGSLIVDTDATDDSDSDSVIVDTPPTVTINQAAGQADPTQRVADRVHGRLQRGGHRLRRPRHQLHRQHGRRRARRPTSPAPGPTYTVASPA